ncbi:hypothetical protein APR12_006315 [Nocardia amikacinitolerans]|nr:hypothetical protein [Nocardia amikacinitolerans]
MDRLVACGADTESACGAMRKRTAPEGTKELARPGVIGSPNRSLRFCEGDPVGGANEPTAPSLPGQVTLPPGLAAIGLQDTTAALNSQQAQQRANDAQTRIQSTDDHLDDLGYGSDPDFAKTEDHFEGMTHEQLYAAVHGEGGLDPAGLQTLRRVWIDSYSDLVNISTVTLGMGMSRIFGNGLWKGASADAAQVASEQFKRVTNQVGQVFNSVGNRLDAAAWAAEAVRLAVQAPPASVTDVTPDPDNQIESILPGLINPAFADQVATERERARQEAIQALNTVYKGSIPPQGSGVPSYADVPQSTGDNGVPPTSDRPVSSGPGTNSPTENGPQPQDPATPGNGPDDTTPASSAPTATTPSGLAGQPPTTNTSPATTSTTPSAMNTGPGGPSLTSPGPRLGDGSNGPGNTGPRPGGPGSSIPGLPGSGLPGVNSPNTTGPGARGGMGARAGMGGSMGPTAPGAGAQRRKEDESEHRAPDYLRRVHSDWTDNLEVPVGVVGDDQVPGTDNPFPSVGSATSPAPNAVASARYAHQYSDDYATPTSANSSPAPAAEANRPVPVMYPGSAQPAPSNSGLPEARQQGGAADSPGEQGQNDSARTSHGPRSAALSGNGPTMDDAPETTENTTESQPIRLSGTGPIMDDNPATPDSSNQPQPVRLSGTGPVMDDNPAASTGR